MNYLLLYSKTHALPYITDDKLFETLYLYHKKQYINTKLIKNEYLCPSNIFMATNFDDAQVYICDSQTYKSSTKDRIPDFGNFEDTFYKGLRHSFANQPAVNYTTDNNHYLQMWYQMGIKHRENGPQYISDICKKWYRNGLLHRVGLPAIEYVGGHMEWWENGECVGVNEGIHMQYIDAWEQFKFE